tara:strand:+ start:377 stop:664 length:288 start_codon:yes stop_codon:yes gene_type:complete
MKFKDLNFKEDKPRKGVQAWVNFPNGFEVSVVKHLYSYGGEKGFYEIGVFKDGIMCDPLGWGDDVKGWLKPEDVEQELASIGELKSTNPIVDHLK